MEWSEGLAAQCGEQEDERQGRQQSDEDDDTEEPVTVAPFSVAFFSHERGITAETIAAVKCRARCPVPECVTSELLDGDFSQDTDVIQGAS